MRKTAFALLLILLCFPVSAQAVVYNVNHSFASLTNNTATLTGTLTVPLGNYVIQNKGASPFTNVNLSLTVNASSYNLVAVDTSLIFGTGQFLINAAPTTLTFSTANANGANAADLSFWDVILTGNAKYVIGSDADPRFEVAETSAGKVLAHTAPTFPVVFGTVPEPSTLLLLGIGAISLLGHRKAKSRG
jgi:hypothetical protein